MTHSDEHSYIAFSYTLNEKNSSHKFNLHWRSHTTPRAGVRDELTLISQYLQIRSSLRRRVFWLWSCFLQKSLYHWLRYWFIIDQVHSLSNFQFRSLSPASAFCHSALVHWLRSDQVRSIKLESKCQKTVRRRRQIILQIILEIILQITLSNTSSNTLLNTLDDRIRISIIELEFRINFISISFDEWVRYYRTWSRSKHSITISRWRFDQSVRYSNVSHVLSE